MQKINRGLEADGILNGAGNGKWHPSNFDRILRNEKYIVDTLLQKTYAMDFLTKARVKNHKITVYEDKFTVKFEAGVSADVE
jgi:site-specific DNA recombinase